MEPGPVNAFDGFANEDFDAYRPEKWGSNVYTLPRRRVKAKLDELGRRLGRILGDAGLGLVPHLSDEFPSLWNKKQVDAQWLFFSRDDAARGELSALVDQGRTLAADLADPTPRYRHVFLGVDVNHERVEVGLHLHHDAWVDRKNLINLLSGAEGRTRLVGLLSDLPDHYEVAVADEPAVIAPRVDDACISHLAELFDADRGFFFVGIRIPRDQVAVLGGELTSTLGETLLGLVPIYRFLAWAPDNDAISATRLIEERRAAIAQTHGELERERRQREERRAVEEERRRHLREEVEERVRMDQAWREREIQARRHAAQRAADEARAKAEALAASWGRKPAVEETAPSTVVAAPVAPAPVLAPPSTPRPAPIAAPEKPAAPRPRRERTAATAHELKVGERAEVRRGVLRGRVGVIQELDDKGFARVAFGALASRFSREELAGLGPVGDGDRTHRR